MLPLEALAREAEAEVGRQMQICNACRYCESYCAVFPAITRRLEFGRTDVHYLANLCHNCGACLHACQYASPHAFAVNLPRAMAQVRLTTYAEFAWPQTFGAVYRRNGLLLALAAAVTFALFVMAVLTRQGALFAAPGPTAFYGVFAHGALAWLFGLPFAWAVIALAMGAARFWREQSPGRAPAGATAEAMHHAVMLTYLGGGHGDGCNEESDRFTNARRRFHHLTSSGFALCFASTSVATLYHYGFGWHAPYAYTSLPVILGVLGGLGLLAGTAGLLWLNLRRHPQHGDPAQRPMDRGFAVLLFTTSLTGLALLALRTTPTMGLMLALHLGCVMALFLTLPYGKFAHAVYRVAALLKFAIERRMPNRLQLGAD